MHADYFPPLDPAMTPPTKTVCVISTTDEVTPEEVIEACQRFGASSQQSEGLVFWVVFEDEPKTAQAFTERALRVEGRNDRLIRCRSFKPGQERMPVKEVPDYMLGTVISHL